jgi:hypothetical protein
MLDTNATFGPEIITFNIGSGPQTITPASRLPTITETVTIDATTQPGFAGQPIIELNMSQAGENVSAFVVRADSTVIRGFVINRHGLGSTVTGGINLRTGAQNIIEGNYIGTDLSGTLDMADFGAIGVDVNSSNNTVGGTTAATRNLLSGVDVGVNFFTFSNQQPPTNNKVQGNFIGTNPAGSAASNNSTPFFGVKVTGTNNIIGGTVVGAGNLISVSRSFAGIDLAGSGTTGNLIQGNFIGTDVSGLISIGNISGVAMSSGASSNTVGGSTPTARNLISGNSNGVGIGASGTINSTPDNIVQGNYIGTDVNGAGALANNSTAIIVPANVVGSQINANRIAFNSGAAVQIRELGGTDAPGIRVAIFENEIYANGFGIDLGPSGITANDAGDPDDGANLRQNFPILTSAMASASSGDTVWEMGREMPDPIVASALTINGTLNSTPNAAFTVHWYFNTDAQCTTNQAATRPLVTGKVPNVMTNSNGDAQFSFPFDFPSGLNGGIINCTATDAQGNTSEFSACFPVSTPARTLTVASSNPATGVSITVSPNDNSSQGNGTTQFTRTYNNGTPVSLTAPATASGNNFQKWLKDGADFANSSVTNVSVTMDTNHTMTAVYVTPPPPGPSIFVEAGTNDLAALDSVTLVRGPFALTNTRNFSSDQRTRIIFYTTDLGFAQSAQPDINTLSVQMGGNSYTVESVGPDSTISGSYIVFRLPDLAPGTYPLGIRIRGVNSANTPNVNLVSSPSSPAAAPKSNKAKLADYLLFPLIDLIF